MTERDEAAPFIFMIAGEPSGDALGGALIAALRQRTGNRIRIAGIGGEHMAQQGLSSLVPLSDLAVAGVTEVLPRAPLILRRVRQTVRAIGNDSATRSVPKGRIRTATSAATNA